MADKRLDNSEIESALKDLPGWSFESDALNREFRFADFSTAFGFMAAMAVVAAEMNHHPEWCNVYSKVTLRLSTHDVGGVSQLDIDFARRCSDTADRLSAS